MKPAFLKIYQRDFHSEIFIIPEKHNSHPSLKQKKNITEK